MPALQLNLHGIHIELLDKCITRGDISCLAPNAIKRLLRAVGGTQVQQGNLVDLHAPTSPTEILTKVCET